MSKKTFKSNLEQINNPSLQFISETSRNKILKDNEWNINNSIPEGYKIVPEAKSRRLQLLIQPSLYEKIKDKANKTGTSVNDTIHSILSKTLRKE